MKRLAIAFVLAVVTAVVIAAPAGAARQQTCSEARILRAAAQLSSTTENRYGLQLYQWERCGARVGVAFG